MENKDIVDVLAPGGEVLSFPTMGQKCYESLQNMYLNSTDLGVNDLPIFFNLSWKNLPETEKSFYERAATDVLLLVIEAAAKDALNFSAEDEDKACHNEALSETERCSNKHICYKQCGDLGNRNE